MKRFARLLLVTVGFGALGFVMSLVPQKNAGGAPAGAPVSIVNSIPLMVGVNNFPAALAGTTVPVSGNVGVTGGVGIANTVANPVPTLNVDEPTAQPFVERLCLANTTGVCAGMLGSPTSSFTVPTATAGGASVKRLVVEFVSGACVVPQGNPLAYVVLGGVAEQPPSHFFGLTYAPGTTLAETFGGKQTRIYYDPGETVGLTVESLGSTFYECFGTLSGYLATQ